MEYLEIKKELKDIAEIVSLYPEKLQEKVYSILINNSAIDIVEYNEIKDKSENYKEKTTISENSKYKKEKKQVKKGQKSSSYNLVNDVNLLEDGDPKFLDFCKGLLDNIANEKYNAVCVYYLEKVLKLDNITLDHIYTCYKIANKDYKNLNATISNSKNRGKYIYEKESNNYRITQAGQKLVEIDLPKVEKDS